MKSLLFLSVAGVSAWIAFRLHRRQQQNDLPTAEHKKQAWQKWCLCQNPLPDSEHVCRVCSCICHDWMKVEEQRRRDALQWLVDDAQELGIYEK